MSLMLPLPILRWLSKFISESLPVVILGPANLLADVVELVGEGKPPSMMRV